MEAFETELSGSVEAPMKHHFSLIKVLTARRETGRGTVSAGQFDWGGFLPKSNGGVRSLAQPGWQSGVEDMARSQAHCETYKSSRRESGSK